MDIRTLIDQTQEYLPSDTLPLIEEAYEFASQAHQGQVRRSGEPYLEHPLQSAMIIAELQLDASSIAATLLHDVPEDCRVPLAEIRSRFGDEVASLVDGTTKLGHVSRRASEGESTTRRSAEDRAVQAENLRKMLLAVAKDIRVVFIKLADRLHNMRTLEALPPEKRRAIAQETMEIYAPLAHRLGIWEIKWQLEDLSFRYLKPLKYRRIARLLATRRGERESFIAEATQVLKNELAKAEINAQISGRPKHIYSIHQKMERYAIQGKHFDDIHDLLALRVLVGSLLDCYNALGSIHSLWHPIPGGFDDFIANPKGNGYQSLHTAVMYRGTTPLEIQIRTYDMHRIAECGIAAHWRYKEGDHSSIQFEEKISWLRQIIEWHREVSGVDEFLESVKTDIFIDQVFVFTPQGEIKALPKGATPLDFAYRIHTELGHRCIGAKVNGVLAPLHHQLNNGDAVEILASKGARAPSRDWLNPNLGYIKTAHAQSKIRQWFRRQERTENIERGKQLLDREFRRLGINFDSQEELARLLKYDSMDDLNAAIGCGDVNPHQAALKLITQREQPRVVIETARSKVAAPSDITVQGEKNMLTHIAHCCTPLPGDEIVGYITRGRGITVHRKNCHNIAREDEKERLIAVEWGYSGLLYPVSVEIQARDRVGLLRDVSALVAEEKVNIAKVSTTAHDDNTNSIFLSLETKDVAQLSRLLARIEGIKGVISAIRGGEMPNIG